ncbi:hypothetical protein PIROE2DRAFT_14335 [Piromyces sp. E2]|nr:hypothetical protein PIROE2DRAFT_14335 [Piromyces sp. E2]|eukprot:OUM59998.1 hypothetical protein PIROE2DRAFT_14335 [Piromyces sp. E2]
MVNSFNEYSTKNDLDIEIHLDLFTPANATRHTEDFCSVIDQFLQKRSTKYDIYFYNNIYTSRFEPHFVDLNELLPKNHTDMYVDAQTSESYSFNNKLIGLPVFINYSVMYNNMVILNKYNRTIPKTWNELLETGKYILEKEKEQHNDDILIYNGAFIDDEIGMGSIYEFMYSFRDSLEDPFPDLLSENAVNSLIMMKKLKNEISSGSLIINIYYIDPLLLK